MLGRLLPSAMLACLVLAATGCHSMHPGMYGGCGVGPCGGACGGPAMPCNSGCGEVYWGEWTNHPPDCCDPCDGCGNYVGGPGGCWPFPILSGLHALWGYRYGPAACGSGCDPCGSGCDSCGASVGEYMPMETMPMEYAPMESTPTLPAPEAEAEQAAAVQPRRAVRHATYMQPQRTRVLR